MLTCAGAVLAVFAAAPIVYAETTVNSGTTITRDSNTVEVNSKNTVTFQPANGQVGGAGSEGGMEMKGEIMISDTLTEDEMRRAIPMEKNIDADDKVIVLETESEVDLFDDELEISIEALVEGEDSESHQNDAGVVVDSATKVKSSADFEQYVAFKAKSDERIKKVEIKDGKVEVTYALPVKFFGFWKTSLETTAKVDSTGTVEVRYPWYAIFMRKEFSKKTLEPAFRASLEAHQHANANSAVQATTTATVSAKAYVVPHVFDTVVITFAEVSSSELSYTAKAGKTGKTK